MLKYKEIMRSMTAKKLQEDVHKGPEVRDYSGVSPDPLNISPALRQEIDEFRGSMTDVVTRSVEWQLPSNRDPNFYEERREPMLMLLERIMEGDVPPEQDVDLLWNALADQPQILIEILIEVSGDEIEDLIRERFPAEDAKRYISNMDEYWRGKITMKELDDRVIEAIRALLDQRRIQYEKEYGRAHAPREVYSVITLLEDLRTGRSSVAPTVKIYEQE